MDYTIHGILQARILELVAFPFSRGSSDPWIEPRYPALQVDSLPAEPQGKPQGTQGETADLIWQGQRGALRDRNSLSSTSQPLTFYQAGAQF